MKTKRLLQFILLLLVFWKDVNEMVFAALASSQIAEATSYLRNSSPIFGSKGMIVVGVIQVFIMGLHKSLPEWISDLRNFIDDNYPAASQEPKN